MIPPSLTRVLPGSALATLLLFLLAAAPCAAGQPPSAARDVPARRVVNDRCPVMTDDFASPLHEVEYRGSAVRFCCRECVDRFEADPVPFLKNLRHLPPEVVQAAIAESQDPRWTRPMLLGSATLLAVWVAVRLWRRRHRDVTGPLLSGGPHPTA